MLIEHDHWRDVVAFPCKPRLRGALVVPGETMPALHATSSLPRVATPLIVPLAQTL